MSFVEVIPIEDWKGETVIKAYMKYMYADEGGSKFILTDKRLWILKWRNVQHCTTAGLHRSLYITLLT